MDRSDQSVIAEDLGVASVETRGGFQAGIEPGGKLLGMLGIADDD